MLNVGDWAEVRRLRRSEQLPISEIARALGISRNTVKAALASDGPPKYQRAPAGSVVDEVEPRIRELLAIYPRMPATVIAERIGWSYSIRTLSERVRELRPVYLPPDPASRTTYVAGEIALCDFWFPDVVVPVGYGQTRSAASLPVLTMVCGYSRWASAVLIPTRTAEDLYTAWWQHISLLSAVLTWLVESDAVEVVADRSSVLVRMPGNGRDRPASFTQGVYLQVVLPCEHEKAGLLQMAGAWSETTSFEGDPPSSAEPHG